MPSVSTKSNKKPAVDSEPPSPFLTTLETDISNIRAALSGTRPRVNSAEARHTLDDLDALTRSIAIAASERYAESMKVARKSSKEGDVADGKGKEIGAGADAGTEGGNEEVGEGSGVVGGNNQTREVKETGGGHGGKIGLGDISNRTARSDVKDTNAKASRPHSKSSTPVGSTKMRTSASHPPSAYRSGQGNTSSKSRSSLTPHSSVSPIARKTSASGTPKSQSTQLPSTSSGSHKRTKSAGLPKVSVSPRAPRETPSSARAQARASPTQSHITLGPFKYRTNPINPRSSTGHSSSSRASQAGNSDSGSLQSSSVTASTESSPSLKSVSLSPSSTRGSGLSSWTLDALSRSSSRASLVG